MKYTDSYLEELEGNISLRRIQIARAQRNINTNVRFLLYNGLWLISYVKSKIKKKKEKKANIEYRGIAYRKQYRRRDKSRSLLS
jgi:hypothetical protein